jgi:hypothetical protein
VLCIYLFKASLVSVSTFSLPVILTCPGTQNNVIFPPCLYISFLMVCVLGFFVRFLFNTAIILLNESVIITFGSSFFHVLYIAFMIADCSLLYIEFCGCIFLFIVCSSHTTVYPTYSSFLNPSVFQYPVCFQAETLTVGFSYNCA